MNDRSTQNHRRTLFGTNLTPGESLRLFLLLCGPPWLLILSLIALRLVPAPQGIMGWLAVLLAGPAVWGAFVSAIADGRTLLGREKPSDAPKERLWQTIQVDQSVHVETVGGSKISTTGPVAEDHSAAASDQGTAVVGDRNTVITAPVQGNVQVVQGDLNQIVSETPGDPVALRQSYLNRVLEQTQTLQLSGVDPKSARDATARTGLALAAVYTALMTQQAEQERGGVLQSPEREMRRLSAVELLNREPKLALLGDPGSGKTTFVNFVALCLAGEALGRGDANLALLTTPLPAERNQPGTKEDKPRPQAWGHRALLPVRVVLRDFAAEGLPPIGQRANAGHLWRFIETQLGATLAD